MSPTSGEAQGEEEGQERLKTWILPCDVAKIGTFTFPSSSSRNRFLDEWDIDLLPDSSDADNLRLAAQELQEGRYPVAFPTETVYGLGADATRSSAVREVYRAKGRPADNPLIVHVCSLGQLKRLLLNHDYPHEEEEGEDPIPQIYRPLISKFWPGPLTILLPLPDPSPFASEVTNNLRTVGVRMPSALLALALIKTAGVPLAAPSANASSKPSPTSAAHVLHDLDGRIRTILDGGACQVGLESTVVDGLSDPPLVLRPGAVSIEILRRFPGWENVKVGYSVDKETSSVPRAPGMKYRHYSPKAKVVVTRGRPTTSSIGSLMGPATKAGILRTSLHPRREADRISDDTRLNGHQNGTLASDEAPDSEQVPIPESIKINGSVVSVWVMELGSDATAVAKNLFSGLRELDLKGVDVIFAESMDDREGDLVAAVMNRVRKAAEAEVDL